MPQSIFDDMRVFEMSESPATPPTNTGVLFIKTDGNWYLKNDAGEEVQVTSGANLNVSGKVNEYIWDATQVNLNNSQGGSNIDGYPIHASVFGDALTTDHILTTIRIPEGIIEELASGRDLLMEYAIKADGNEGPETGSVVVRPRILIHDQSASTTNETILSQTTQAVSSTELTVFSEQTSVSADSGDSITPRFDRLGDDASDTLTNEMHLVWVRMSTTEASGS